jgi:ERF superfamily protein
MSAVPQQIPARQPLNIYQRVNAVRKAVSYIQKDKRVGGGEGGYLAVTHDAVTSLTREHFVAQGIVVVPNILTSAVVLTGTATAKGVPFIRYEARYRFDFVNIDDPADRIPVEIEAHAIDQGDKAPGKALSYGKKAAVLKLLEIESGDDEEDRPEQTKVKAAVIKPTDGAMEGLSAARRNVVMDTAVQVQDFLTDGRDFDAFGVCESLTDPDEKVAMWSLLNSGHRSRIKAAAAAQNKAKA